MLVKAARSASVQVMVAIRRAQRNLPLAPSLARRGELLKGGARQVPPPCQGGGQGEVESSGPSPPCLTWPPAGAAAWFRRRLPASERSCPDCTAPRDRTPAVAGS